MAKLARAGRSNPGLSGYNSYLAIPSPGIVDCKRPERIIK
jgi:hypothetical protein